jgi:histidinol-phosphate/aromatic aminotransferase/cobyric acid decarboxylase-like protein
MKHTPGPWAVGTFSNDEVRDASAIYSFGRIRPIVYDISGATLEEADANANLIAAAPDLLAALKRATALLARYPKHDDAWRDCRAAIAKAEGVA